MMFMYYNRCKECFSHQFTQCKDNPCNYRIQKSNSKYSRQFSSHSTDVDKLINLDKDKANDLLYGNNRSSILSSLLRDKNININRLAVNNIPLLLLAYQNMDPELVKLLLSNGANPNIRNDTDDKTIKNAIFYNCTHVLDAIVEYGCDINQLEKITGYNNLHYAIYLDHSKMVKHLLHLGFDPNSDHGSLNTYFTKNTEILELLLSHGAKLEKVVTRDKKTLAGRIIKLKNSISCSIDWEIKSRLEYLQVLLKYFSIERCENHEYSVNGCSLLHLAADDKDTTILEYLLKLGLNPNSRELHTNKTPLHIAAESLNARTKTLLTYGSRVEAIDHNGNTALHEAVKKRKLEDIRDLLIFGARSDVINVNNKTAINLAIDKNDERIIEWMLLFGADFDEIERLANSKEECFWTRHMLAQYVIMKKTVQKDEDLDNIQVEESRLFKDKCKNKLDQMKNFKILDSDINCFDLLHASRRKLVKIACKWPANEIMSFFENNIRANFPYYANWLWKNINVGITYAPVYDKAIDSLDSIVDSKLPLLVIENVMIYLNFADMKNLIKICQ